MEAKEELMNELKLLRFEERLFRLKKSNDQKYAIELDIKIKETKKRLAMLMFKEMKEEIKNETNQRK